jgi:hypothetical protein
VYLLKVFQVDLKGGTINIYIHIHIIRYIYIVYTLGARIFIKISLALSKCHQTWLGKSSLKMGFRKIIELDGKIPQLAMLDSRKAVSSRVIKSDQRLRVLTSIPASARKVLATL